MIIRAATDADCADFTACLTAAYAPYVHLGLPDVTAGISEDIRDHSVWIAQIDGAFCGGVVLNLDDHAHIANIAVDPNAAGRGIGRALIDQAKKAARGAGYGHIQLATHVDMIATQAFYRKLGWVQSDQEGDKMYFSLVLQ